MSTNSSPRCPVWDGYPSWVKKFNNQLEDVEEMYIEFAEYPEELRTPIENTLPFNFKDEGWRRNLTDKRIVDGQEEPSFAEQIPMHYKQFFMTPHVVYPGVLFLLFNAREVKREKPLVNPDDIKKVSLYNTVNVFVLYEFYRSILLYFEGHFMIRMNKNWADRTLEIFKRHGDRLGKLLDVYQKRAFNLPGVEIHRVKSTSGAAKPLDLYDEKLAGEFGDLSFRYCVSMIHILELALIELLQIDPELAVKNSFLTIAAMPPVNCIPLPVKKECIETLLMFCEHVCNSTTERDKYDMQHIRTHCISERHLISPSYFYQTLTYLAGVKTPESMEEDEKIAFNASTARATAKS